VVYTGGVGIGKNLYVGGNILVNGFALSTATTYNGGRVTLPIFLDNNTASTSTNSGALIVGGGVGIAGDVNVGGTVNAGQLLVNGLAPTTSIKLELGNGLVGSVTTLTNTTIIGLTNTGILSLNAGPGIQIDNTGTLGVSTITNTGVLSVTGVGPGLYVSNTTGNITLQNTGVTSATAGTGISISTSTGSIVVTNIGVTQLNALTGITLTANTGSISIINAGVTSLTAGTDTRITSNTGDITVWDVSTLQSVTDRGYTTTNPIQISNATGASSTISGALQVVGGAGIGQNLWVGGYSQVIGDSSVSGAFNLTGLATLNSSANITGRLTLTGSGITEYVARIKGGGSGDQIAFGTSGSAGYGVHLDVLNAAGNGYAPFASTASSYSFYINGTPSVQINSSGNLVVQTGTASNDYTGGAVQVAGGVGITGALNVNGKIASNSGYVGLNPWTIFTGTSNVTVVDSGSGLREVDVVVSGTNVTRFYNNSVYVPVTINSADVVSTSTITRSGNVSKGAWGATGVALSVPSATYTDTTSVGSVGSSHVTAFGQPTISASNNTSYTNASTVYIGNAPAQGSNVTLANSWSLYVNAGKVKIADTTPSNNAQTGALQVAGGVGIGGDVNIDGVLDVNGNAFAVGNSEIVTFTSPVLTNNSVVNLDTFATSAYQSAKYFIQVVDNTAGGQPNKMYITELIVYHDGNGQIYISEYGMASNLGDLGDFDASITGGTTVQLTFKPNYTPTSMVVKVHRTTLSR
jgi:hypothetical protein